MAGHLEKRGKDTYRLIVGGGVDQHGNRIKHTKTIKATSKKQAEKALAAFVTEVENHQYISPSRLTLSDFSERWLRDYVDVNLAPKTAQIYRDKLNDRILPALGHLKLEQIKPLHILDFYSSLQKDGIRSDGKTGGLGAATIQQYHRVLSSILKHAVDWKIISDNPASSVKPPKIKKQPLSCLDEVQAAHMLEALAKEPLKYQVYITLGILTGLRRGEILGLEWAAIDFNEKTISITQASQIIPGQGVVTTAPKTATSNRVITVPEIVINLLKSFKAAQNQDRLKCGELWENSNRLLVQWNGKPMHPNTIDRWFPRFLEKNGLPIIRFHDLRHSAASIMITQGIDVGTVSKYLGHSKPSVTSDIYLKPLQTAQQAAANKMDSLFAKNVQLPKA